MNYNVDKVKDRDIYLEHVQNEGQEREDDDDVRGNDHQIEKTRLGFFRTKVTTKRKTKIFKVCFRGLEKFVGRKYLSLF